MNLVLAHVAGIPVEETAPWLVPTLGMVMWNVRMTIGRWRAKRRDDPDESDESDEPICSDDQDNSRRTQ